MLLPANVNAGSEQKSFLRGQAWHPTGLTTLGYNLGKQSASRVPWCGKCDPDRQINVRQRLYTKQVKQAFFSEKLVSRLAAVQGGIFLKSEMENKMEAH